MSYKLGFSEIKKLESSERKRLLPAKVLLSRFGLREDERLADIGCGSGFFTFPAAELVGSGGSVYGIDISQEFINYCKDVARKGKIANVEFLKSEESSIPLADHSVDSVLLALVLHEMNDPASYFKEVGRILKPGGKAFVIEWRKKKMSHGPAFEERFSSQDIGAMAKAAGMEVEDEWDANYKHYALILRNQSK